MDLLFRVGSTGVILKSISESRSTLAGLEEKSSKERPYTVVEKYFDYEERHYPSCTVVATKLQAKSKRSSGIVQRYLRLRNYFIGLNETESHVERLTPALTKVEPVGGLNRENTYTMTVPVSQEENKTIPKPKDGDVYVTTLPAMSVYVRTFEGRSEEQNINKEVQYFKKSLANKGDYNKDYFYTAGYDSPFKMFNRRNEIWFVKK